MLPFIAIEDQEYSTYLAGAINFSSGCPRHVLFQNQSSLSPNSSRSELLVHMDCIMKSVLQKNRALTSHVRLRKRRAKATGFRNRLHISIHVIGGSRRARAIYAEAVSSA